MFNDPEEDNYFFTTKVFTAKPLIYDNDKFDDKKTSSCNELEKEDNPSTDKTSPKRVESNLNQQNLGSSQTKKSLYRKIKQKMKEKFPNSSKFFKNVKNLLLKEDVNHYFLIWLIFWLIAIQKDEEILKKLFLKCKVDIEYIFQSLFKEKKITQTNFIISYLLEVYDRNNLTIVSSIMDYLVNVPNEEVCHEIFKTTLKKMNFSISFLPHEIIQNIIKNEKFHFLNLLLLCRNKKNEEFSIENRRECKNWKLKLSETIINIVTKKELTINKHEVIIDLTNQFIQSRYSKLTKLMIQFSKKMIKNPALTVEALENGFTDFIFQCLKQKKNYASIFLKEQIFLLLVQMLQKQAHFQDIVVILYQTKKYIKYYDNLKTKLLIDKLQSIIEKDIVEILGSCSNPIGILILICEMLRNFSIKNKNQSLKIKNIANDLLNLTCIYLIEIKEISILTHILFKPILPKIKIKIIDILMQAPLYFRDILSMDFMENILKSKLCDGYQYDYNFLSTSTAFQYISSNFSLRHNPTNKVLGDTTPLHTGLNKRGSFSNTSRKIVDGNIFRYLQKGNCTEANENNHIHTYLIFTRNVNIRLLIGFFFFSFIVCMLFYEIYFASQLSSNCSNIAPELISYSSQLILPAKYKDLIIENLKNLPLEMRNNNLYYQKYILNDTGGFSFKKVPININNINPESNCYDLLIVASNTKEMSEYMNDCILAAKSLSEFYQNLSNYFISLSIIFMVSSEILIIKFYLYFKQYKNIYISPRSIIYYCNLFCSAILFGILMKLKFSEETLSVDEWISRLSDVNVLFNCQLILLMMKLFFYLGYAEKFGKVIQIIILVLKELFIYTFVIAMNTCYMGLAFHIFFSEEYPQFRLLFDCVKMSFEGLLGSFNFIEATETFNLYIYFTVCAIYSLICNTVFQNLIIAVLNNTYQKFNQMGKVYLLVQTYEIHQTHGYHKYYSSMMSFPPPFNCFSWLIVPILAYFKNAKVNDFFLKISYIIFSFVPFCLLFLVCSSILIPLAWLKILFLLICNSYKTYDGFKYHISSRYNILHIVAWCLLGLFYLIFLLIFSDFPNFFKSCFLYIDNRTLIKPISEKDWKVLKKSNRELKNNGKLNIEKSEFAQFLIEKYINKDKVKYPVFRKTLLMSIEGVDLNFKGNKPKELEVISPTSLVTQAPIKSERNYEGENLLQVFKQRFKAEQLFHRFAVDNQINISTMNLLLNKLKNMNKNRSNITENKKKKAYSLINLISLNELSESYKKWKKETNQENKILKSFEY